MAGQDRLVENPAAAPSLVENSLEPDDLMTKEARAQAQESTAGVHRYAARRQPGQQAPGVASAHVPMRAVLLLPPGPASISSVSMLMIRSPLLCPTERDLIGHVLGEAME